MQVGHSQLAKLLSKKEAMTVCYLFSSVKQKVSVVCYEKKNSSNGEYMKLDILVQWYQAKTGGSA
jgi:hypothetical protein